jgi:CubicO group peptidase (beta-lactamase class C family)
MRTCLRTAAVLGSLLLAACRTTSFQPDATTRDIDRLVEQTLREIPDVKSVGLAIVRDGKPYYAAGYGLADVEHQVRADANTGYYIASSTKSYTGLACAVLASRGLIDLDAPIAKYLPEVTSDAGKITLRQFLTHTAPIENEPIVFRTAYSGEHTPAQLVSLLNSSRPRKEGFQYDNLGYVVASLVIERVTGKPWQCALDELVFAPLGMRATTAYMSEAQRRALALPYEANRRAEMVRSEFVKNDQMMHAAGGIVTTPTDLTRWLAANVNDGRIDSRQLIAAAPFAEAHRQQVAAAVQREAFKASGYGFGWYVADYAGDKVLFHLGGFEGWRAHVSFMPEKKIGVAVVTNSGGMSGVVMNFLAASVYDRLLGKADSNQLPKLAENMKKQHEQFIAGVAERAKRPWMLKHPNEAYVGRYANPQFGDLTIEQRGDKLYASLEHLTSVVEAFTEPESARVEIVPNSGSVLRFAFEGDAVTAVKWDDEVFQRVR